MVRVLVLALQRVELGELEVDQVLALPGDAQDDLLETAPGVGEFDRGVDRRALRGVERLGHLPEFVGGRSPAGAWPTPRRPSRRG
jgi:hypothetical protein